MHGSQNRKRRLDPDLSGRAGLGGLQPGQVRSGESSQAGGWWLGRRPDRRKDRYVQAAGVAGLQCVRDKGRARSRQHLGGLRGRAGRERRPGHAAGLYLRRQRSEGVLQDHRRLDRRGGGAGHQQCGRDADDGGRMGQGLRSIPGKGFRFPRFLHGGLVARRRRPDRAPGHQQHRGPRGKNGGFRALHPLTLPALEWTKEFGPEYRPTSRDFFQGRPYQGRHRTGHPVRSAESGRRRGLGPGHERRRCQAPGRAQDL